MDATRSRAPWIFEPSPGAGDESGTVVAADAVFGSAVATSPASRRLDPELRARLTALFQEGWEIWNRFEAEVRQKEWHPFIHGNYERILDALLAQISLSSIVPEAPRRFLEWGSAAGVVTIMADLLGFEAYGIELDADLVEVSRRLAERHDSRARFAAGSFLPEGYRWRPVDGDGRSGTLGDGRSAYPELGHGLDSFDLVYGYPWDGEAALMIDLMERFGAAGARLLMHGGAGEIRIFQPGRP